ncbi:MAG: hypothetical protein OMM_04756 [Candidatus Magnetoglobus multicellularis str. Araruama]|uniref:Uncharacterized protein n=1 Tax=Candidatus Magnetoglobus multicellularis str. Araruama TaxID=890399 RepID=A0A1V1P027_9BACT|nr:MAG: hypothetical protein OMM_04756 [Candidatus Magnetoglobus multicellularis str. Araruama]
MRNFIVAIAFIILSIGTLYAGVIGDVNNDGKVDLAEAIYSLQVAAGVYPSIDSGCILIGKGAWIENTDYAECDVIESGGLNYVCLQSHTSVTDINAPPNQTYWTQLALKGERGYQGPKGEPGNPMELELPYTFTNQVDENSVTLGDVSAGVYGKNANSNEGSLGTADVGVYGKNLNDNEGSLGTTDVGVYGKNANSGNEGSLGTSNAGIYGKNQNNNEGFLGTANAGVYGKNANNNEGSLGTTDAGVFAKNDLSGNWAKLGADSWALQAKHDISGNQILAGTGDYPLKAERPGQSVILGQSDDIAIQANNGSINTSQNINAEGNITAGGVITVGNNLLEVPTDRDIDIVAEGGIVTKGGIKAFGDIYAVDFMGTDGHLWTKGDIKCGGKLEKSAGTFKIDHPLDPKTNIYSILL